MNEERIAYSSQRRGCGFMYVKLLAKRHHHICAISGGKYKGAREYQCWQILRHKTHSYNEGLQYVNGG